MYGLNDGDVEAFIKNKYTATCGNIEKVLFAPSLGFSRCG